MKKSIWFVFLISCLMLLSFANAQDFKSIKIGNQTWMTENLDVDTFRNGDPIPQVITGEEWENAAKAKKPAWCYYNNDSANGAKYGRLYNWCAVNDPRGLAPKGWHIPTNKEWRELTDYLGGWKVAGIKLKSKEGWFEDGNGTNESGFSALPGGRRTCYDKNVYTFDAIGKWGFWWTSTKFTHKTSRTCSMRYSMEALHMLDWDKTDGMSVRCVKDE
jgi:uncharacterized protein (TIGR02145 family)